MGMSLDTLTQDNNSIAEVNSIFQQSWWLDAVAPGVWQEVVITRGNQMVARMPYVMKRKYGLTVITMPPLTQTLGPWCRSSGAKYAKQLSYQHQLYEEIVERLPRFDYFSQNFSPEITNWLPFYWNGFNQTTRYTYRIENLDDLDAIWSGLRKNIRTDIRKAKRRLIVRDDLGVDKFLPLNRLTFQRQGKQLPYSPDLVRRIDDGCAANGAKKILFAEDASGNLHAALYIVWDHNTAYYLMGGSDPELRNSGASSLLMWEAIKFASGVTKCFDFEGSMLRPVERFFRAFGARQVPYFHMRKMSRRLKVLSAGRDCLKALMGKDY